MQSLFRQKFYQSFKNAVLLAVVLTIAGTAAVTFAQSSSTPPQVTSVTVTTVTNNSAAISFTTNVPAGAKINYGPTTAYGTSSPTTGFTTPERTSHVLTLDSLSSGTTYHFQIEVQAASGTAKSADRTFTTKSASSSSGAMVLTNILAQCDRIRCQISFMPSRNANVRVVWGPTEQGSFDAYPAANIVADPVGTFSNLRRALVIPNQTDADGDGQPDVKFTQGTIYFYRLQAFEEGVPGPSLTTENFQLRTAQNDGDFTFSTGGCLLPNGTTINIDQCGPGGYYCPSGGGPAVQDCTKPCGYICPADSTCRTSGACEGDPSLSGSPFQCNKTTGGVSACYDENGQFRNPAPAGCYGTWGKCNANTILKVRKDRGCNLWLTCATSVQTEAKVGAPAENLCLTLAACNSLNQQGQCNRYLPQGQCDNDPLRFCATDADCSAEGSCNLPQVDQPTQALKDLTFTTPTEIKQIAKLSGSVTAGLDWNQVSGANVIQGGLPWQLMRQVGGDSQITNGDLEYNPPTVDPWIPVPAGTDSRNLSVTFEDQSNSINHVLNVALVTEQAKISGTCSNATTTICSNDAGCPQGGICEIGVCSDNANQACSVDSGCTSPATCNKNAVVNFAGAATKDFTAEPGEYYYAEVRLRAVSGSPKIRVQFGHSNYTSFNVPDGPDAGTAADPAFIDVEVKSAWQRVTLGPITGMSGNTRLGVVCADNATCTGAEILVDDVQVKPILQVSTNPSYITPSCRLYPKADSPACDYFDQSGVLYKGWKGYCLENDSVTGTCLSWWPVDILRGESSLFSSNTKVGYTDRVPLYLCAEAIGNDKRGSLSSTPYLIAQNYNTGGNGNCNQAPASCDGNFNSGNYTIAKCGTINSPNCSVTPPASAPEYNLTEDMITRAKWVYVGGLPGENKDPIDFINDSRFKTSSFSNPYTYIDAAHGTPIDAQDRVNARIYRDTTTSSTEIFWRYQNTRCDGGELNNNCVSAYLVFDAVTKKFLRYVLDANDNTGSNSEIEPYRVEFYTKEYCSKLVEVVKPDGVNQAYAARVQSPAYNVPDLNYRQYTDLGPFGGAVGPLGGGVTPSNWPILPIEAQNLTRHELPGQSRGGQPYACDGPCNAYVCSANPGLNCLNSDGTVNASAVQLCEETDLDNDGVGDGVCTGTTLSTGSSIGTQTFDTTHPSTNVNPISDAAFFAQERLRRVFTQAYSLWEWTNGAYRKTLNADGSTFEPWTSPQTLCPVDPDTGRRARNIPGLSDYPKDYCAVPPQIIAGSAKFVTEGGTTATITGGSGSIGIKFNTDADPEQVPLQGFSISWGDSKNSYAYPYAPKNDPASPHIFSHVYNNTGPTCTPQNPTDCCTSSNGRKTCNYEIRIRVKDNWGWCNNADAAAGNKCPDPISSWYDTGLRVRVQP